MKELDNMPSGMPMDQFLNGLLRKGHSGGPIGSAMKLGFVYDLDFLDENGDCFASWPGKKNLMNDESLAYAIAAAYGGGPQFSSFYIGAYTNNRAPLSTDTSANIPEFGEITSFAEVTRQLWNRGNLIGSMYDSSDNPTILTATVDVTISGVLMSTDITPGGVGGKLISAFLGESPELLKAGRSLSVPASIALENS